MSQNERTSLSYSHSHSFHLAPSKLCVCVVSASFRCSLSRLCIIKIGWNSVRIKPVEWIVPSLCLSARHRMISYELCAYHFISNNDDDGKKLCAQFSMIYACLWICLLVFCGRRTVMGNLFLCVPPDNALQSSNAHFEWNRNKQLNGIKGVQSERVHEVPARLRLSTRIGRGKSFESWKKKYENECFS